MYIVDTQSKRLIKAEKCTFKSLNFKRASGLTRMDSKGTVFFRRGFTYYTEGI